MNLTDTQHDAKLWKWKATRSKLNWILLKTKNLILRCECVTSVSFMVAFSLMTERINYETNFLVNNIKQTMHTPLTFLQQKRTRVFHETFILLVSYAYEIPWQAIWYSSSVWNYETFLKFIHLICLTLFVCGRVYPYQSYISLLAVRKKAINYISSAFKWNTFLPAFCSENADRDRHTYPTQPIFLF